MSDLQARYGRAPILRAVSRGYSRTAVGATVLMVALGVAFSAWFGLSRGRPPVSWQVIGYTPGTDAVHVRFVVTFADSVPAQATARCTVEALNLLHTQVGRIEVSAGPAAKGQVAVQVRVPTSEPAVVGDVQDCRLV